ncbi:MAG TPA: Hsp70 family protein [Desulfotomaculum sp.]|nr:Hsp70 family protein [Desulfotomaculum sp.]
MNDWPMFPLQGLRVFPGRPVRVLGIDLGTTNSAVAEIIWDPGRDEPVTARCLEIDQDTLEGRHTHTLVSSVVAFFNDRVYIGEGAKRLRAESVARGLEQNRNIFYECKNDMGIKRTYHKAPEGFRSAPEIGGHILRFLYEAALAEDPLPVDRVVVTVPASFQTGQRADTLRAAQLAGLELLGGDLLDEPVAAFIDYLFSAENGLAIEPGEQRNLVVFDFGGGTCDVAVFCLGVPEEESRLQIAALAVSRYHRLGGGDIDRAIVHEILIPELLKQNGLERFDLSFSQKKNELEPALLGVAETLKIGLCIEITRLKSFNKYEGADKDRIYKKDPAVHECQLKNKRKLVLRPPTLTAAQFEELLAPFLDRDLLYARETEYRMTCSIFAPLQDALERSGLKPGDVDFCLLMGGSSLIPQVRDAVQEFFPAAQILAHPDRESRQLAVARGAAYHALYLELYGKSLIQPVCHDDIAIRTEKGPLLLVPKGTPLPHPAEGSFAECDGLTIPVTLERGTFDLRLEIVAGEDGRLLFTSPWRISAPLTRGEPVHLHYLYDENQILFMQLSLPGKDAQEILHLQIEKPLTSVVNPESKRLQIFELEEELRLKRVPASQLPGKMVELADLYADLKQYEKAIDWLKAALVYKKGADAHILNKLGIYCGELGDREREEKFYREAAACSSSWGGPWFNLALAFKRRGEIAAAVECVEKALARERLAPYLILRAQLAEAAGETEESKAFLREGLLAFDAPRLLSDWELGWLITAARLAGDEERLKTARAERNRRSRGVDPLEYGQLPDLKTD